MDKKKFTSWGISFGSLALVAGMVSYLGLTTANKTAKANISTQTPAAGQDSFQQSQSLSGDNQSSVDDSSSSNYNGSNSAFGSDDQTSDNSGAAFSNNGNSQDNGSFSGGFSGHQRSFDTTTGAS